MADLVQFRRDTYQNWYDENPKLQSGELGLITDKVNHFKIGDGRTLWRDLKEWGFGGTIVQTTGTGSVAQGQVMSQDAVTNLVLQGYTFKGFTTTPENIVVSTDRDEFWITDKDGTFAVEGMTPFTFDTRGVNIILHRAGQTSFETKVALHIEDHISTSDTRVPSCKAVSNAVNPIAFTEVIDVEPSYRVDEFNVSGQGRLVYNKRDNLFVIRYQVDGTTTYYNKVDESIISHFSTYADGKTVVGTHPKNGFVYLDSKNASYVGSNNELVNIREDIAYIEEEIGKKHSSLTFYLKDYSGVFYADNKIVKANSFFNSFIFRINKDTEYYFPSNNFTTNIFAFKNKPTIGPVTEKLVINKRHVGDGVYNWGMIMVQKKTFTEPYSIFQSGYGINSEMEKLSGTVNMAFYIGDIEQGNIDTNTGKDKDSNKELRIKGYVNEPLTINLPKEYQVTSLYFYDKDTLEYKGYENKYSNIVNIGKENCVCRFNISRKVGGSINVTDVRRDKVSITEEKVKVLEYKTSGLGKSFGSLNFDFGGLLGNSLPMGATTYSNQFFFNQMRSSHCFEAFSITPKKIDPKDLIYLVKYSKEDNKIREYFSLQENNNYIVNDFRCRLLKFPKPSFSLGWEYGSITQSGKEVSSLTSIRTSTYIPIEELSYYIGLSGNVDFSLYDSGKNYLGFLPRKRFTESLGENFVDFRELIKGYENLSNVKYVRLSYIKFDWHPFTEQEVTSANFLTIAKDLSMPSVSNVEMEFENKNIYKNVRIDDKTISFMYELNPNTGRNIYNPDGTEKQIDNNRYYNSGLLRLPSNYSPSGKPVPLIIYCHPSNNYILLNSNEFAGSDVMPYFEYLQKEGFAIFDCFAMSSKYYGVGDYGKIHPGFGGAINMACIQQGYKWVIENYNIDPSGCFVTSKSAGGYNSMNLIFNKSIPIKAVAPLAPAIDASRGVFGYKVPERKAYANDMEFDGDLTYLFSSDTINYRNEEFKAICERNKDKINGYIATYTNVVNKTTDELLNIVLSGEFDSNIHAFDNVVRISNVPLKIFIALDDKSTPYPQSYNFIKSLQNGHCIAELRTFPAGLGGHSAVDTSPTAPRVPSLVTKLGYTCTNIPVAYVEMVSFFRRFGA